jgi:hypothetical protein
MAASDKLTNFINALIAEQRRIERDLPKDSRIVVTIVLVTGEEISVASAYPNRPDMLVFTGVRNRKTITMMVRYEMIAQVVFRVEKGKPQGVNFSLEPPQIGFRSRSHGSESEKV